MLYTSQIGHRPYSIHKVGPNHWVCTIVQNICPLPPMGSWDTCESKFQTCHHNTKQKNQVSQYNFRVVWNFKVSATLVCVAICSKLKNTHSQPKQNHT